MTEQGASSITDTFRFVKWMRPNGAAVKGWFRLEISPFPSPAELPLIISDIHGGHDIGVSYSDGHLFHDPGCLANHELDPDMDRIMRKVINTVKPRTFRLALLPGVPGVAHGQPLAVGLDPRLDYTSFPDHPHLNAGNGEHPDSLCYTDNIPALGATEMERISEAIRLISIWLFRHTIWQESRRYHSPGIWIGPAAPSDIQAADYPKLIDPEGRCRCGKSSKYKNCHLPGDLKLQPILVASQAPNSAGRITDPRLVRLALVHQKNAFVNTLREQKV